jgi:hypothetical protein
VRLVDDVVQRTQYHVQAASQHLQHTSRVSALPPVAPVWNFSGGQCSLFAGNPLRLNARWEISLCHMIPDIGEKQCFVDGFYASPAWLLISLEWRWVRSVDGTYKQEKTEVLWEKTVPVRLCPPHISQQFLHRFM